MAKLTVEDSRGHVKDVSLADYGVKRIEWAARDMPVVRLLRERFQHEQPLKGLRVSGCLHITTETANLAITLQAGGASVEMCASNPLSTQDDVAAALVSIYNIPTFAIKGESNDTYYHHIRSVLNHRPQITMDDGADLVAVLHTEGQSLLPDVMGGTEETTTGVIRLKAMARAGQLKYPIIAVNDADTKHFFDNRYGTGQSTVDGITRATNLLWAGRRVVIAGYGWCGRGVAMRAKGLGSHVIVTEIDPIRALEAVMDGFQVMPMLDAAPIGDLFITTTGGIHAIDEGHLKVMKDGALLANSGHFNVEININALESMTETRRNVRDFVEEFLLEDGRRIYLLAEGRLINLAAAEGHPSSVMDMSFANQALSAEYLAREARNLPVDVYPVPKELDEAIGRIKLASMGIDIDTLTEQQMQYLDTWSSGT